MEEEHCDCCDCCDCCCGCCSAPLNLPQLLTEFLKVEGAENPEIITNPHQPQSEDEMAYGDHITVHFPPNSYVSSVMLSVVTSEYTVKVTAYDGDVKKYEKTVNSLEEISPNCTVSRIEFNNETKTRYLIDALIFCGAFTDRCSHEQTGDAAFLQPLFECKTCNFEPGQCICKFCADKNHSGHELVQMDTFGFCDSPSLN